MLGIVHTSGSSRGAFRILLSFSRMPAVGLRIFHQNEYMLHDYGGPVLGGAIEGPTWSSDIWEDGAATYLVFQNKLLSYTVKVAFTHVLEPVTYTLLYEFFVLVHKGREASLSLVCRDGGQSTGF